MRLREIITSTETRNSDDFVRCGISHRYFFVSELVEDKCSPNGCCHCAQNATVEWRVLRGDFTLFDLLFKEGNSSQNRHRALVTCDERRPAPWTGEDG